MEELNNHKVPKIVAYFSSASTTGSIKSQTVIWILGPPIMYHRKLTNHTSVHLFAGLYFAVGRYKSTLVLSV